MISPRAKSHLLLGVLGLLFVTTIVAVVPNIFKHVVLLLLWPPLAVVVVPALFLGACYLMRSVLGCLGWPRGRAWGGAVMSVGVLAVLLAADVSMSPPRSETLNHPPASGDGYVTRLFRWALRDQPNAESRRASWEAETAYAATIALEARIVDRIAGRIVVKGTVTNKGNRVVHRVDARVELEDGDGRHVGAWIVRVFDSLIDVAGADPMPLGPGESREFKLDLRLSALTHGEEPHPEPLAVIPSVSAVSIEQSPAAR